jgi:hypothetical protein
MDHLPAAINFYMMTATRFLQQQVAGEREQYEHVVILFN